ncbi:hypothetical protein JNW89_05600 [Micromonospora sp. 4G55]|nr:helix-turn-helix transcriptional regulator [Micromonospora sp. 4G55]MBM0256412.1 hypothetical protein [Micromonospora sp. 4G55]
MDDVHLLDATSVVLLRQLMDAGLLFLIATVRSDARPGPYTGLTRDLHRMDLADLNEVETGALLEAGLRAPVSLSTRRHLYSVSRGNPLYLRELVMGAVTDKTLTFDGEVWHSADTGVKVTKRLQDLVDWRMANTPPAAHALLETLALCQPLSLSDAMELAPSEVVHELEAADIISFSRADRRTSLTLAHPIYGEALRAAMPPLRRRTRLVEQIQRMQRYGFRRAGDALRLASWQLEATGTAEPALLTRAAAYAAYGNDNEQVITLLSALPPACASVQTDLLLGNAHRDIGNWREAETFYRRADCRSQDEATKLAVVSTRTMNLFWAGAQVEKALEVNRAAYGQVTSEYARAMLRINEAQMVAAAGDPVRGLEHLANLPISIEEAEPVIWLICAAWEAASRAAIGQTARAIAISRRALAVHRAAQGTADLPHPVSQAISLVMALAEAGRLQEAVAVGAKAYAEVTSGAHEPMIRLWLCLQMGRAHWIAGRASSARRMYAEAISIARSRGYTKVMRIALSGLAASASVLRDPKAAEAALDAIEDYPLMGFFAGEERLGEAWLHASQGRLSQARGVLHEAAQSARGSRQAMSEALILTDIARLGQPKETLPRLEEIAHGCDGALAPARARLVAALAAGEPAELLVVSGELETIGSPLLAAEACAQAALILSRAGDPRRAAGAANRSRILAQACGGPRTPLLDVTPAATADLTSREREIARLAAERNSSREIAELLHLSVRTVENHLQKAYGKLGVKNRVELSRVLNA